MGEEDLAKYCFSDCLVVDVIASVYHPQKELQ